MVPNAIPQLLGGLRQSLLMRAGGDQTDGQLLAAFVGQRDTRALEALVRRHALMVWGVCRRTLAHHDAEDAFQATFLVLVRRAASISTREPLANWLYGVAHKTACKVRQMVVKRSTRERQVSTMPEPRAVESPDRAFGPEFWQLLHEELSRLPEKYRRPIVLCDLEGRSRADAAGQLHVRPGTVASRLMRGRAMLARRLIQRGLGLSATSLVALWSPQVALALPDALLPRTIEAAGLLAANPAVAAGLLLPKASTLTDAVLRAMGAAKWRMAGLLLLLVGLALGAVIVLFQPRVRQPSSPEQPARSPVTVTVVAAYPGATPEEVERQVALPLEAGLARALRLESVRSKSLFGVCWLYASFPPGTAREDARSEVVNCLARINNLPPGVTPQIAPGPGGAEFRYVLSCPRDAQGKPVYTLHDLRSLQDWVLEREFRTVPGVADVEGSGGVVKRYEIHPDPHRLHLMGITLNQLADAMARSNASAGGDYLNQGSVALTVRGVGLIGGGAGQFTPQVLNADTPAKAAELLRAAERRRILEIRKQEIGRVNNQPILIEDVVEGGRVPDERVGEEGVVIGGQSRTDRVFSEREEVVHGVILLRAGEDPERVRGVRERIRELNASAGKLLPGVRVEPYYASRDAGENHLWIHGTLPLNVTLEGATELAHKVRAVLHQSPEVDRVIAQLGGSAPSCNQVCFFVGLKAKAGSGKEPRARPELIAELKKRLTKQVPGTEWLSTASDPLALEQIFPDTSAEHLLLIVGPDFQELERLAGRVKGALGEVPGIENVGIFPCFGSTRLEFRVDEKKCAKFGLSAAAVNKVVSTLSARALTGMAEGEKLFDVAIRWPPRLRNNETSILDTPLDLYNNQVVPHRGPSSVPSSSGSLPPPSLTGSNADTTNPISNTPRVRLRDVVSPVSEGGAPEASYQLTTRALGALADLKVPESVLGKLRSIKDKGYNSRNALLAALGRLLDPQELRQYQDQIENQALTDAPFYRSGAEVIYRSQGRRVLPIRFSVRGRPLAEVQAAAAKKITSLLKEPYRIEWTDPTRE
jgi:RNA polymerase sigma factor (sigma-70 family)